MVRLPRSVDVARTRDMGGSTLGQGGTCPPDSLVPPRFKSQLTVSGNLQRSSIPPRWWGGGSLPSRTPPPLSVLRDSFLRVSESNPLQSWQPY